MRIPIALVQFDAVPEQVEANLARMADLIDKAARGGARWIMFHEGTVCDYTPRLGDLAEPVPGGPSIQRMIAAAQKHDCFVSFGLSERNGDRFHIAQVFVGPDGYIHHYRKTWLWRNSDDEGYRDEWSRYDPGAGPERFLFDGVAATCFICADGEAPRCIERAAALEPAVVFYPNNRAVLPEMGVFGERAKRIGAPMLVTNRVGLSWQKACQGGCVAYDATGAPLAQANRSGDEEILFCDLGVAVP